jgi:hypothetical protein
LVRRCHTGLITYIPPHRLDSKLQTLHFYRHVLHPLMPVVISKLEGGGRQLVIRLDHYFAVCGFSFDSRFVAISSPGSVHANDW